MLNLDRTQHNHTPDTSTINLSDELRPTPIMGASDWLLFNDMPPANTCAIRHNDFEIDTTIFINKNGQLVLSGGKPDWQLGATNSQTTLIVDNNPPLSVKTGFFQNVVIAPMDAKAAQQLSRATWLTWKLPGGTYRTSVAGISKAIAALRRCDSFKPKISAEPSYR